MGVLDLFVLQSATHPFLSEVDPHHVYLRGHLDQNAVHLRKVVFT